MDVTVVVIDQSGRHIILDIENAPDLDAAKALAEAEADGLNPGDTFKAIEWAVQA